MIRRSPRSVSRASSATESRLRETREKRRRRRTLSIERLRTETRIGPAKLQERGLIKYLGVIAQRCLRINTGAFRSSTELPLTHEFRGRGGKKRHHIQRNGADKQQEDEIHHANDGCSHQLTSAATAAREIPAVFRSEEHT